MKKAIIILTILSAVTFGFAGYEGYLYINSLDTLNDVSKKKSEIIETNTNLEIENNKLEEEYKRKTQELLETNESCELWQNQEEVLKKIKE